MAEQKLHNLFFALWPDNEVRLALHRLQDSCSDSAGRMHHPEDLHMTLVFLGKVLEEQMPCVYESAASVTASSFSLELTKIEYWKRPKILWCGPESTPEPLAELVSGLQQKLLSCGFEPERRVYKPHITLARKARYADEQRLEQGIVWKPRQFVLAGSHSGAKPPRYKVLRSWGMGP